MRLRPTREIYEELRQSGIEDVCVVNKGQPLVLLYSLNRRC